MSKEAPASGYARIASPLGDVLLLARAGRLSGLYFVGQRDDPGPGTAIALAELPASDTSADRRVLERARDQVDAYFAGRSSSFDLPLDLHGTPFQQSVWQALLTIPFGRTVSYGDIATSCGRPAAVRAVGRAVGSNPVSIIVPCHRVIGRDGSMTGFGGGIERKQALLALEAGNGSLFG